MPAPFETIPRMMAFLTRLGGSPAPKHGSAAAGGQMDGISLLFVIDRRSEGSNLQYGLRWTKTDKRNVQTAWTISERKKHMKRNT